MTAYGTAGDYTLYESDNVAVSNAAGVVVKVLLGDVASKTVMSKIFVGGFECTKSDSCRLSLVVRRSVDGISVEKGDYCKNRGVVVNKEHNVLVNASSETHIVAFYFSPKLFEPETGNQFFT
jgi:hypothetical protein